jgi:hypothetical protein
MSYFIELMDGRKSAEMNDYLYLHHSEWKKPFEWTKISEKIQKIIPFDGCTVTGEDKYSFPRTKRELAAD